MLKCPFSSYLYFFKSFLLEVINNFHDSKCFFTCWYLPFYLLPLSKPYQGSSNWSHNRNLSLFNICFVWRYKYQLHYVAFPGGFYSDPRIEPYNVRRESIFIDKFRFL